MPYIYPNLTPGQQASRESVEKKLLWGPTSYAVTDHCHISSTCVDARSTVTTELLPGLVLGKITSTGEYAHYLPTATDGTQIAVGLLAHPINVLNASAVASDQHSYMIVAGAVKNGECGGLDQFSRSHLFGRIIFDDDYLGNRFGWKDVVAKTADYTVTAGDNGTIFTNRAAVGTVIFTLPTIVKGLRYRFFAEAAQTITVTSVVADTLVTFNDLAADTVSLQTGSEIIGGGFELIANDNATKWLVFQLCEETQTVTVAT